MDSNSLKNWVTQQFNQIGYEDGVNGKFIGRAAVKEMLIECYPEHEERIRQLVNRIELKKKTPQNVPAPQPAAMPLRNGKTAELSAKSLPLKSDVDTKKTPISAPRSQKFTKQLAAVVSNVGKPRSQSSAADSISSSRSEESSSASYSKSSKKCETPTEDGSVPKVYSNAKISELKKYLAEMDDFEFTQKDDDKTKLSTWDLQLELLHLEDAVDEGGEGLLSGSAANAVLFSGELLGVLSPADLPQYGLLGRPASTSGTSTLDPRVFLNTNIPFSAFVCGVQGSGKSHTTACMVENCLIPSPVLGVLQSPLSVLVFNFAEYVSGSNFRPCELAFLGASVSKRATNIGTKKVTVLVSPSNFLSLNALYSQIPGVKVQRFMLRPQDLSISTMLTLMAIDQTHAAPLYMGTVTKILRDMASESANSFNYLDFRSRLDAAKLDRTQVEFLNQRLDLLESFLDLKGLTERQNFAPGEITIVDLSCPFVDSSTACVLFKIAMGLYLQSDAATGKVIVLDEAHKYMTDTPASKALTESLMGVIRQQRHYGARIIISTQEPSISPKLIDLCSITVMHRFSSPEWLAVLKKHILLSDEGGERDDMVALLREIMRLKTGEALVFAPSAVFGTQDENLQWVRGAEKLLKMRMRKRVTWDGGRSIVCV